MICEAFCASLAALDRHAGPYRAPWKCAAMKMHQAETPGGPVGMSETGEGLDREEPSSKEFAVTPDEWCQIGPLLGPTSELVPVAMTGSLMGSVVDPCGLLTEVCLLIRDHTNAVVRECYPASSRVGHVRARFEVRGLPADTYILEVRAPGFCREVRRGVRVEASCVTDVGIVRLMGANVPRIAARLWHEGIYPPFLHPAPRGAGPEVRRYMAAEVYPAIDPRTVHKRPVARGMPLRWRREGAR